MGKKKNVENTNVVAKPSSFEVTIADLQKLMENRGPASVKYLNERYGGIQGLCSKLKTSTHDGKLINVFLLNFLLPENHLITFCLQLLTGV